MNETWAFSPGRTIWNLRRRGDEARLHFDFYEIKIIVRLGQALAANSPPDCWNYFFEPVSRIIKKKTTQCVVFFFMERVTRLELATSTLARWRSTG